MPLRGPWRRRAAASRRRGSGWANRGCVDILCSMRSEGSPAPASALPSIGQVLGGKYVIVRPLGEGGMAFVFEASHQRLEQKVAIKVLAPEFARDPELVARFEREARAVARLRTRHAVRVMDVDVTEKGVPYIVMDLLAGRDLDAELGDRGRLPVAEAVDYVLQACAAMHEAHAAGIIHRDLKPANLFLADENGERVVKVLDFGVSKVLGEVNRLTRAGAVMGTVLYMAPEQVRGASGVDARADIWSLGVILFELLAGRPPWDGSSQQVAAAIVSSDAPDVRTYVPVSEGLARAIQTMLQRDPARRFADVRAVATALAPFAPRGSVGAVAAEQMGAGTARPSEREATLENVTVPLAMPSNRRQPSPAPLTAPLATAPLPAAPPSSRSVVPVAPPKSKLLPVLAAVVGVLGALGVVLIVVAVRLSRTQVPVRESPPPSTTAPARSAPAASAAADPRPPATGTPTTAPRSGTPIKGPSRKDAGPPAAASSIPAFL